MRAPITVPDAFARKKFDSAGERGRTWITALPALIDELLDRWSCTPDGAVMYGEVGIVVPVRHRELPPAVIKVSFPHPCTLREPDAYAAWQGIGAVQLFARADEHFAMLLERAHGTLATVTDPAAALAIQGGLTRALAVEAPAGLPRLSDQMADWARDMIADARALGDPLPRRVLDAALATIRELGHDQPNTLVHGDLHDANVLAADRAPWLAIDPKCLVGDPAHDALNVIRSPRFDTVLRLPDSRADLSRLLDIYCDAADIDPLRARRWMQVGAVGEALWGRVHADPDWLVRATDQLAEAMM
ncbi:aminoglycoside phosphotransferase family protein [Nocardia sp. NPDC058176]|uniref:aminoglycoside phosphotransferase family protein n=1 Tax=Nocardia sp. NPDC058176 TaxID=3346368 RepID=UPI0036DCFE73